MRSWRRPVMRAVYLLAAGEIAARLLLVTPWVRARLPTDVEMGWRVRWAWRRLSSGRDAVFPIDVYDPDTGWALRPGLRGFRQFEEGRVSSNSRGVRGTAEHAAGRLAGRRRIVVLGDSFTFGDHVDDGQAYPHLIQQRLGAEVINLAVHGYGHDQMLIRLRAEAARYAPDLVLLGFYAGDAPRNLLEFRDYAKPRFVLREGQLELAGSPVPPPGRVLLREAVRSHLLEVLALPWRRRQAARARAREEEPLMAALLDQMGSEAARMGARFAIVDLPDPEEIPVAHDPPGERLLLEYAVPRGVPVCRTREELRAVRAARPRRGHYDPAQHEAVARAVARCLSEGGLLPPPAPGPSSR